jgi:hypothetical protein
MEGSKMKASKTSQKPDATGVADTPVLLTPAQLAARLAVPVTWIREKTRTRARKRDADPLPVVPLGKYVRFDWSDIVAWLKRQASRRQAHS